jgi:hypothetical protein
MALLKPLFGQFYQLSGRSRRNWRTYDEVLATLTLKIDDDESSIWELYNNLEKHGRLVRVRRLLLELVMVHPHT